MSKATKVEMTPSEIQILAEKLGDDPSVGEIIEAGTVDIEVVCELCRGTGKIVTGEFDNHVETKCPCSERTDEDDDS